MQTYVLSGRDKAILRRIATGLSISHGVLLWGMLAWFGWKALALAVLASFVFAMANHMEKAGRD